MINYFEYKIKNDISIIDFLKEQKLSKNFIMSLKSNSNNIIVNELPARLDYKLKINDSLKISKQPKNSISNVEKTNIPLNIVYQDEDILVVNKPANIVTIPSKRHFKISLAGMVANYFQQNNFTFRPINRLDKEASGLVLIAKNLWISERLYNCNIDKTYVAITNGIIDKNVIINKNILTLKNEDGTNVLKRILADEGKCAKTLIFPVKKFKNLTLCNIKIENGRTHQIRLHLSSIGHSIIGDELYGTSSPFIDRTALHLKSIKFIHPISKKDLFFEIDLPNDFLRVMTDYNDIDK